MNTTLINKINQAIHGNRCREITAPVLNSVLKDMVNKQVAEVTYAELATFITEQKVTPGILYKIKDRGDLGIFVTGLTKDIVSKEGIRLMLCPATYDTVGEWIGIWSIGKTVSVGSKAIWGGKVWRNLTGSLGTSVDDTALDSTNWQLVPKDAFADEEYIALSFGVTYDFANDWIEKQWDGAGNVFGVSYVTNVNHFYFDFNPCDISDWNYNIRVFFNNECVGVWNNTHSGDLYGNLVQNGSISNNSNDGGIYGNHVFGGITSNSNGAELIYNRIIGTISGNSNFGDISYNANNGDISNNGASVTNIQHNVNNGSITASSIVGDITDTIVDK